MLFNLVIVKLFVIIPTTTYNAFLVKVWSYLTKNEIWHIYIIGIKYVFSCINIRQIPREVLKTEAGGRGFQHLPRDLAGGRGFQHLPKDLANVNALKKHVRSLLLHKK